MFLLKGKWAWDENFPGHHFLLRAVAESAPFWLIPLSFGGAATISRACRPERLRQEVLGKQLAPAPVTRIPPDAVWFPTIALARLNHVDKGGGYRTRVTGIGLDI